jgi:hypothetical protein
MVKIIQVWVMLSAVIGVLIYLWSIASGKELWQLTIIALIAILCGLISSVLLSIIYYLF